MDNKKALALLGKPGILLRKDGTSEVFYIDEDSLQEFLLPDSFQVGGVADKAIFETGNADDKSLQTGNELQRILNQDNLFRKTNLLNAIDCDENFFVFDKGTAKIGVTAGAGKNHKPIIRFKGL